MNDYVGCRIKKGQYYGAVVLGYNLGIFYIPQNPLSEKQIESLFINNIWSIFLYYKDEVIQVDMGLISSFGLTPDSKPDILRKELDVLLVKAQMSGYKVMNFEEFKRKCRTI